MNNSTRQAVTAALMAGFFMVANGLALAWTLTSDGAHMRRGFVIVMIAISDNRRSIDVPNRSFAPSADSRRQNEYR